MYCPYKPNFQKDVSLNELNLHPHFNPRVSYQQQSLRRFNAIKEDFALIGEGGFSIQKTILVSDISFVAQPTRFDLTHTFQIEIPASVFNSRLGVFKNSNGNTVGHSENFDTNTGLFINDSINISYETFIESFSAISIISLGIFEQLYTDFIGGVNRYFGLRGTDRQLINELTDSNIDGKLSFLEFYNMLSRTRADGTYYMTGFLHIKQINDLLRNTIITNAFGNRSNKSIGDGFVVGDKILFFKGLEVKFNMDYGFSYSVPDISFQDLSQPYYLDTSVNAIPNLDKSAIGDILFVLT